MINILNVNSPRENAMAFFPELDGARRSEVDMKQLATQHADVSDKVRVQMAVSGNTLNPTNATLWASVADSVVDAVSKKYVDMRRFAYAQSASVALPAGVSARLTSPTPCTTMRNTDTMPTTPCARKYSNASWHTAAALPVNWVIER